MSTFCFTDVYVSYSYCTFGRMKFFFLISLPPNFKNWLTISLIAYIGRKHFSIREDNGNVFIHCYCLHTIILPPKIFFNKPGHCIVHYWKYLTISNNTKLTTFTTEFSLLFLVFFYVPFHFLSVFLIYIL